MKVAYFRNYSTSEKEIYYGESNWENGNNLSKLEYYFSELAAKGSGNEAAVEIAIFNAQK